MYGMDPISNSQDIIDSREVIERIEWLAGMSKTHDESVELDRLRAFALEGQSVEDWQYGATLIRESYFVEYAKQLADDIGLMGPDYWALDGTPQWPFTHIDWEAAAEDLKTDYSEYTFDGVTYYAR